MPDHPTVAISRIDDPVDEKSIEAAVRKVATNACDFAKLVKSRQVVIKPNVYCPSPAPTTTDPRVVASLIRLAKDCGAKEVVVAEGRSISTALFRTHTKTTRACFEAVGMDKAATENGARIVYLEEDQLVPLERPEAAVLKKARVMRTVYEAEVLINVPVLKNHSLTLTTLGIKNLHGILSDEDKLFAHDYRRIPYKLVDILRYVKPDLTVVDGVRGQEGDHADQGRPIDTKVIIAGTDVVAVDAIAEAIMGLENLEVDTTRLAHQQGIGVGDRSLINIVGDSIDTVSQTFARPDIEISEQRFPGLRIRAGDYCKGCQYYIRRGIDRLASADVLEAFNKVTIVFGKDPAVEESLDGTVIIIGDCALESESVKRLRNRLWLTGRLKIVYSCPPMEFRMRALDLVKG